VVGAAHIGSKQVFYEPTTSPIPTRHATCTRHPRDPPGNRKPAPLNVIFNPTRP